MSTAFVFVLIACVLLVVFGYLATRRGRDPRNLEGALAAIRSLDVEAFRNLVDPAEEDYLRAELLPRDFRRVKRERTRAALAYVRALSKASLEVARFGDAAQRSADSAIAASGKQIANSATQLRLRTLEARASLMVSVAFPGLGPRPLGSLLEQYDRATHLLESHSGLRRARSQASS